MPPNNASPATAAAVQPPPNVTTLAAASAVQPPPNVAEAAAAAVQSPPNVAEATAPAVQPPQNASQAAASAVQLPQNAAQAATTAFQQPANIARAASAVSPSPANVGQAASGITAPIPRKASATPIAMYSNKATSAAGLRKSSSDHPYHQDGETSTLSEQTPGRNLEEGSVSTTIQIDQSKNVDVTSPIQPEETPTAKKSGSLNAPSKMPADGNNQMPPPPFLDSPEDDINVAACLVELGFDQEKIAGDSHLQNQYAAGTETTTAPTRPVDNEPVMDQIEMQDEEKNRLERERLRRIGDKYFARLKKIREETPYQSRPPHPDVQKLLPFSEEDQKHIPTEYDPAHGLLVLLGPRDCFDRAYELGNSLRLGLRELAVAPVASMVNEIHSYYPLRVELADVEVLLRIGLLKKPEGYPRETLNILRHRREAEKAGRTGSEAPDQIQPGTVTLQINAGTNPQPRAASRPVDHEPAMGQTPPPHPDVKKLLPFPEDVKEHIPSEYDPADGLLVLLDEEGCYRRAQELGNKLALGGKKFAVAPAATMVDNTHSWYPIPVDIPAIDAMLRIGLLKQPEGGVALLYNTIKNRIEGEAANADLRLESLVKGQRRRPPKISPQAGTVTLQASQRDPSVPDPAGAVVPASVNRPRPLPTQVPTQGRASMPPMTAPQRFMAKIAPGTEVHEDIKHLFPAKPEYAGHIPTNYRLTDGLLVLLDNKACVDRQKEFGILAKPPSTAYLIAPEKDMGDGHRWPMQIGYDSVEVLLKVGLLKKPEGEISTQLENSRQHRINFARNMEQRKETGSLVRPPAPFTEPFNIQSADGILVPLDEETYKKRYDEFGYTVDFTRDTGLMALAPETERIHGGNKRYPIMVTVEKLKALIEEGKAKVTDPSVNRLLRPNRKKRQGTYRVGKDWRSRKRRSTTSKGGPKTTGKNAESSDEEEPEEILEPTSLDQHVNLDAEINQLKDYEDVTVTYERMLQEHKSWSQFSEEDIFSFAQHCKLQGLEFLSSYQTLLKTGLKEENYLSSGNIRYAVYSMYKLYYFEKKKSKVRYHNMFHFSLTQLSNIFLLSKYRNLKKNWKSLKAQAHILVKKAAPLKILMVEVMMKKAMKVTNHPLTNMLAKAFNRIGRAAKNRQISQLLFRILLSPWMLTGLLLHRLHKAQPLLLMLYRRMLKKVPLLLKLM